MMPIYPLQRTAEENLALNSKYKKRLINAENYFNDPRGDQKKLDLMKWADDMLHTFMCEDMNPVVNDRIKAAISKLHAHYQAKHSDYEKKFDVA